MLKINLIFILFITIAVKLTAQSLELLSHSISQLNPAEAVYLHTDKELYFPHEKVWFKAYVRSEYLPSGTSTNLFADLLDQNNKIISELSLPSLNGTANGAFDLPDSITSSTYFIRAYTNTMMSGASPAPYIKKIRVSYNDSLKRVEPLTPILTFFPEGGNLISELNNHIAFKANYVNGYPFEFSGMLKNSKGQILDTIKSEHDGMGVFQLVPELNESFFVEWIDPQNQPQRTPLPTISNEGVTIHTDQLGRVLYCMVEASRQDGDFSELLITGVADNKLLFNSKASLAKSNIFNSKIPLDNFPSGVLTITVFSKSMRPLAEKLIFVDNHNYSYGAKLNVQETNREKRKKNVIEIETMDTVPANFSLSVFDAGLQETENRESIYSGLLLSNDIRGYVYNPGWYFENNDSLRKKYLDYVMLTNGWRRYNWGLMESGNLVQKNFPAESYLLIRGKLVNSEQQALPNEAVNLVLETRDSARQWLNVKTGQDGIFEQKGLIFFDSVSIYYQSNNKNLKNATLGFSTDNGMIRPITGREDLFSAIPSLPDNETKLEPWKTLFNRYDPMFEQKGKTLETVTLKSNNKRNKWKNDPMLKMDEKYATMFRSSSSGWSFDVLHDEKAKGAGDIYNYMNGKVPGLNVSYKGYQKKFVDRIRGMANDGGKGVEPLYFIDEQELPSDVLETLDLNRVAYIKYYDRFPLRQGLPPALCIYMKKQEDYKEDARQLPGNLSKIKIAGYSPFKEFYSPDYSVPENLADKRPDIRTTLLWVPYILTDKNNRKATIIYYNNDISIKLRIVLEGMNDEGKLIHLEKGLE